MFYRQRWKRAGLLRRFVVFGIAILMVLMNSAIAVQASKGITLGQLPSLTTPSTGQPLPIGVERRGTLEAAGVHLDRKELFKIASPAVLDRSVPGSQIPVEVRAKQIEANLEQLIAGNQLSQDVLSPETLEVVIETVNGQPVLFVKDAVLAEAKVLLTVTDADAQFALLSQDRLAEQWKEILEWELRQALEQRQPKALQQQIYTTIKVFVSTLLLTLILWATWTFFGQRKQQLAQRQAAETAALIWVCSKLVGEQVVLKPHRNMAVVAVFVE